jgi:hypothetical protein
MVCSLTLKCSWKNASQTATLTGPSPPVCLSDNILSSFLKLPAICLNPTQVMQVPLVREFMWFHAFSTDIQNAEKSNNVPMKFLNCWAVVRGNPFEFKPSSVKKIINFTQFHRVAIQLHP